MATYNNYSEEEEGRPPDSSRKLFPSNAWSLPNNLLLLHNNNPVDNINHTKIRLRNKLFCIKNISNEENTDSASAPKAAPCDTVDNNNGAAPRPRSSYHQDVDEALNSLLWQPYEYQHKSSSSSYCSSSSGSVSDLEDPPHKGPSSAAPHPNPRPLQEVVNNLTGDQWRAATEPRDALSWRSASRLSSEEESPASSSGGAGALAVSSSSSLCCDSDVVLAERLSDSAMHLEVPSVSAEGGLYHGRLSTANVVGLPMAHHPRNGSEPVGGTHNQFRFNGGTPPGGRTAQVSHLRSASVPKSMGHQRAGSSDLKVPPPLNVSNVNVNFYRAVPVNVVSSVPTIQCLNTLSSPEAGNNVSNVHIMPLSGGATAAPSSITGTTQVTVHSIHPPQSTLVVPPPPPRTRTFTSTEAQTDDIATVPPPPAPDAPSREQRRKERRERRHQRRLHTHRHTADNGTTTTATQAGDGLPDLLNHMPPPYTTMPPPPNVLVSGAVPPPVLQSVVPNSGLVAFPPPPVPLVQAPGGPVAVPVPPPSGFRFPFPAAGFRRGRFAEEPPKGCCGLLAWKPGSLRWFIAVIALVAVCCVLVGTALGAMRPAGRDHLTVSLLMIGVGIVLVTVSGIAWRLTSHDSSTCRSMLGLGSTESVDVCARRFVPRLPPSYGRPHHPYAAMMYPEFQYRPPPPSYQASMQEYRLRLLLLDRGNSPQIQAGLQNTVSPPPTYRSHAGSLLRAPLSSRRDTNQSEYSCPPSYRSQSSTNHRNPGTVQNSVLHSREHSLSLSESNTADSVVNVVNILASTEEDIVALDNITLDSLKMEPEPSDLNPPLKMLLQGGNNDLEGKDGNLVTIVQTSDQSPVIVTVSGSSHIEGSTVQITEIPSSEMEILAHL